MTKREIIEHASEAAWLADRRKFITSTEAAGLFDAGSYENSRTFYELFHIKAGLIEPKEFEGGDRVKWGSRLESAIATGVAEDLGLIVEPMKVFITMPEFGMGSSFDYRVIGIVEDFDGDNEFRAAFRAHGPGIMECKSIDSMQFRRNWIDDGETIEATPQIEAQAQWQLEVADLGWSVIAPLVGGNTPRPVLRLRDLDAGAAFRSKAAELWQRVRAGLAPEPNFAKDGDTIAKVYRDTDGSSVDLSDNKRLGELCRAYKAAGEREKAAKAEKDAAKAEVLAIVKAAKSITAPGHKISAGTNKASFRAYFREGYEKITISISEVKGTNIEAEVPAFRNVRISEAA